MNRTSHRSVQELTAERDQALADLNSVERSLSDLFRRYENMKAVLEGFKKVSPPYRQPLPPQSAPYFRRPFMMLASFNVVLR